MINDGLVYTAANVLRAVIRNPQTDHRNSRVNKTDLIYYSEIHLHGPVLEAVNDSRRLRSKVLDSMFPSRNAALGGFPALRGYEAKYTGNGVYKGSRFFCSKGTGIRNICTPHKIGCDTHWLKCVTHTSFLTKHACQVKKP